VSSRSLAAGLLLAASVSALAAGPVEPGAEAQAGPRPLVQRPLWELGLGVSGLRLPDYRGADQSHSYALPFPYVVYRGTWLKADRDGARALLFDSPRIKLDLSFGATAPARSSDNSAREGMPDLPGTGEVGPNLNVTLAQSLRATPTQWKLDLRLPLRAAVSLQRSPRYVGATFSPNLNFDVGVSESRWNIGLLTGPLFADGKYHQHVYGVDAVYATPQRAAYQARGGYAGWQTIASLSRRVGNTWVGAFARHESLAGATYEDSPLVRSRSALTVGFGVAWILVTSSESVASTD
jgi:outer membrane scaffolding protein for murein synthesis (MipA/OmpV family)